MVFYRFFRGSALLLLLSLALSACVSRDAIDRAVNDPERIEIVPLNEITFDPSKTWAAIELASRSVRTGILVFCDMRGTRSYRPQKTTWSGRCGDQQSFAIGTYDGSVFFDATRTQLPDGTLLAIYEIEDPMSGEFAPIARSVNANFPLQVLVDERPVYQFQRGAVHVLARPQSNQTNLRSAFLNAFPGTETRVSGRTLRTFQPICDGNNRTPTCGVGPESGVRGPVIIRESRDGTRTVLNTPASAPRQSAPVQTYDAVPGSPPLVEGTRYASFTPEQIKAYCAQDWSERVRDDGRTEYNPCKRKNAFE